MSIGIVFAEEQENVETPAPVPVYTPKDISDAYEYVLMQAMDCSPEIRLRLDPTFTDEEKANLVGILVEYRMADIRHKIETTELGKELVILPKYKSCVKMLKAYRKDCKKDLTVQEIASLSKAQSILQILNIHDGLTQEEKARTIHDWMIAHCAYDEFALKNSKLFAESNRTAYDPWDGKFMILQNKGVCDSYAQAYWLLLQMVEVPCSMMAGSVEGSAHAWNLVFMNNHWAHVDVTFDDPVPDSPGRICDTYFDLSDKEIAENHEWKRELFPNASFTSLFSYASAPVAVENENVAKNIADSKVTRNNKEFSIEVSDPKIRKNVLNSAENENIVALQDPLFPNVVRFKHVYRPDKEKNGKKKRKKK